MPASIPRKICQTLLLEANEDRASRGLKPQSPKDWAESLERSIDSTTRQLLPNAETEPSFEREMGGRYLYDLLKAMPSRSS
tara:strand:- start:3035 stop:3277 length:243 start_codon:yes stop_codon:yes gene_type:complete